MSAKVVARLKSQFGDRILATSDFRGDEEVTVAPKDWVEVATFLRDDPECAMDHFGDLTAVDWPLREREGEPRFDLVLYVRSSEKRHRVRLKTQVRDGEQPKTLTTVWSGANWAEREIWDMFGIRFDGHKDMRRILLYEEFEGHPLRKDYPIDRAQPLVEYRDVDDITKLPPFGIEEGQPFARIDWEERLAGHDEPVSPSLAVQTGLRRTLSDSEIAEAAAARVARDAATDEPAENAS